MQASAPRGVELEFDALMRLQHLGRAMHAGQNAAMTGLPGGFLHRQRGRGLEVNDLRPWLFGDDIRHIDRNATARTGVQHVRTFRDERDRSLLLVADFRPSMLFGTRRTFRSVAAAECLALIGWNATAKGIRIASLAASAATASAPPGRGLRNMPAIFGLWTRMHAEALADRSGEDVPLSTILETGVRLVRTGGMIVVATSLDTPGDDFASVMHWLVQRNHVCFVIVRDAFERAPPPGLYPYVANNNSRGVIRIGPDFVTPINARCDHLRQLGASVIVADADADAETLATTLEALDV